MRILTYNIHSCIGRDGHNIPDRVLQVVDEINAGVVALQEVDDDREGRDFISELRKMNYASLIYAPTMVTSKGHYGKLLMTSNKAERVKLHTFSVRNLEPRGIILESSVGRREGSVCGGTGQGITTSNSCSIARSYNAALQGVITRQCAATSAPRHTFYVLHHWRNHVIPL